MLNTAIRAITIFVLLFTITIRPGWVEEIQSQPPDTLGVDSNLDKFVTYQTRGECIGTVVDALAQASGAILRAGTNSQDWEVRDRKVSIFANRLPLRDLMNSLSRVTNFKWQVSGEDSSKTYRLVWDNKSKTQARQLVNQSTAVAQTPKSGQLTATPVDSEFYPGFGNTVPLTPEQQANLQTTNPFLAWWQKSGMAKAVGRVMNTVPGTAEAISSGSRFSISGDQLTPDGRKAVLTFLNRSNQNGGILGGVKGKGALKNIRKNLNKANVNVNKSVSAGSFGSIEVSYGKFSISAPLLDSKSVTASTIGNMYQESRQIGKPMGNQLRGHKGDLKRAAVADSSAAESSAAPAASAGETGRDAAATNAAKNSATSGNSTFKTSNKPLSIELMRVSRLLKVSVVSDWFGDPTPSSETREVSTSVPDDVFDDIADRYSYTWDNPSAISEFKDAGWAAKSFLVLPDDWLAGFRKALVDTGTLDLPMLAQMADLTPEQFEVGIDSDEILGNSAIAKAVLRNADILRLYASLSNEERNAVFSADALNLKTLSMGKISLAKAAVARNADFLKKNDVPLLLHGEVKSEGKAQIYQFMVFLDEANSQTLKWTIQTPIYKPRPARTIDTVGPKIQAGKINKATPKSEGEVK